MEENNLKVSLTNDLIKDLIVKREEDPDMSREEFINHFVEGLKFENIDNETNEELIKKEMKKTLLKKNN